MHQSMNSEMKIMSIKSTRPFYLQRSQHLLGDYFVLGEFIFCVYQKAMLSPGVCMVLLAGDRNSTSLCVSYTPQQEHTVCRYSIVQNIPGVQRITKDQACLIKNS